MADLLGEVGVEHGQGLLQKSDDGPLQELVLQHVGRVVKLAER